jgi:antitoxin component of MazEF toxin-antitoxin module
MKFKATIWKTGDSFVFTVPMAYIKNNDLSIDHEYSVEVSDD